MAIKRCLKCGADIPEGAEFCPGCGAPKGAKAVTRQEPQPQQPMYQQPQQMYQQPKASLSAQNVSPLAGIFDMFFSKTGIIMGVAIGILLAWIGVLIAIFSRENLNISISLISTGFAAMGLVLVGGGVWNKKIETNARLGMVLIGGYIAAGIFGNLFGGF